MKVTTLLIAAMIGFSVGYQDNQRQSAFEERTRLLEEYTEMRFLLDTIEDLTLLTEHVDGRMVSLLEKAGFPEHYRQVKLHPRLAKRLQDQAAADGIGGAEDLKGVQTLKIWK